MAAVAALTAAAAEPQAAEKTDSLHVAALSPEEAAAVDSIAALRLRLAPKQIESIFDTNDVVVLDTLDSGNDAVQVVLYSNNTGKYVRNREVAKDSTIFEKYWDTKTLFPYKEVDMSSMPKSVVIDLIDSLTGYHCPYQGSVHPRGKYGPRRRRQHQGVDLPLKTGDPVYATFCGRVRISEYNKGGYGNLVIIRHDNGLETYYGHLSERMVEPNQWVEAGQIIGLGGSTGRSTGPHLHFETRYYGQSFDPERLIDFKNGILSRETFLLKKSFFSIYSNAGQDFDDEIANEEQDKKEAAEKAAMKYHRIKSGDTLGAIARRYGTTVNNICRMNNIKSTTVLRIGRSLRVLRRELPHEESQHGILLSGRQGEHRMLSARRRREIGVSLIVHADDYRFGHPEHFGTQDIQHRHHVPCRTVVRHLAVGFVALDHRVLSGPRKIGFDTGSGIIHRLAQFERHDRHGYGTEREKPLGVGDVVHDIVFGAGLVAEASAHHRTELHLALHQFDAVQRRIFVAPALQQAAEIGRETDGDDHDRAVGTLGQQAAVKGYGIAVVPVPAAAGEKSRLADGACVVVAFEHHAITDPPDRNFGIAVPRIHHIYIAGRELGILAAENAEQGDFTPVHRLVKHIERQRIVHVVAHVGIENHPQGCGGRLLRPDRRHTEGGKRRQNQKFLHRFRLFSCLRRE